MTLRTDLPPRPRAGVRLLALAAALLLVLPQGAGQAATDTPPPLQGKKFAAYEFGWYPINHVDHFEEPLPDYWEAAGTGDVGTQNGMITILSTDEGTTSATLRGHSRARGRWEMRMRARRYETANTDFVATAVLVPAGKQAYRCGARNIALTSFHPGDRAVRFHTRTLPDHEYSAVLPVEETNEYWHTYGVEVTRKRISWFVDGVVRATERRPEALSGIRFALRLELTAVAGATMNKSRLQVDTVRYFTLKSPNDKSIKAPRPTRGTYGRAC